jgi:hypothetical protein
VPIGNLKQNAKQLIENSLDTIGRLLEKVEFENINSIAFQSKDSARFNFYMTEAVSAKMEEKLKGEQLPNSRKEQKKMKKQFAQRTSPRKSTRPNQNTTRNYPPNNNTSPKQSPKPIMKTDNKTTKAPPSKQPKESPKSPKTEQNKTFKFSKDASLPRRDKAAPKRNEQSGESMDISILSIDSMIYFLERVIPKKSKK